MSSILSVNDITNVFMTCNLSSDSGEIVIPSFCQEMVSGTPEASQEKSTELFGATTILKGEAMMLGAAAEKNNR